MKDKCSVDGCDKYAHSKGICATHYSRLRRHGDVNTTMIFKGIDKSPELIGIYKRMIRRCFYKKHDRYKDYGGRGITVCDRWLGYDNGYINFVNDMGSKPTKNHSLDRIDNNGNYEPSNCKWSTIHEQQSNRRNNNENIGIHYYASKDRYLASLRVNGKVYRKSFINIDDAIEYRKYLEETFIK